MGDNNPRTTPTLINNLKNIILISAGPYQTLALDKNGRVHIFGSGTWTQNNEHTIPKLNSALKNIVSMSAGPNVSLFLDENGMVYSMINSHSYKINTIPKRIIIN